MNCHNWNLATSFCYHSYRGFSACRTASLLLGPDHDLEACDVEKFIHDRRRRNGRQLIARLEAAGLGVLSGVRLNLPEPWDGVASVREAAVLQQVTGARFSLFLNDQGEITAACTVAL